MEEIENFKIETLRCKEEEFQVLQDIWWQLTLSSLQAVKKGAWDGKEVIFCSFMLLYVFQNYSVKWKKWVRIHPDLWMQSN